MLSLPLCLFLVYHFKRGNKTMLFKKQICPHCKKEIEATNRTCPYCGSKNEALDRKLVGPGVNSMPFWKQLIYFAIGFVGIGILEIIFSFIGVACGMDEQTALAFVTFATYFVLIAGIVYFTILNKEYLLLYFKDVLPYAIGIIGAIAVIGLQESYSMLLDLLHVEYVTNDNEVIVENLIVQYPALSIILIGIAGPIVEEFTYRLGLFSFLTRVNRVLAYVVTILLFSVMHLSIDGLLQGDMNAFLNELINFPSYIIGAAVLTTIYDLFGISASSIAHIGNNLFVIILTLITKGA